MAEKSDKKNTLHVHVHMFYTRDGEMKHKQTTIKVSIPNRVTIVVRYVFHSFQVIVKTIHNHTSHLSLIVT